MVSSDDTPWIVIMGAAVRPDGTPSGAMRRRVAGALEFARTLRRPAIFLPTGGVGRAGPAEAQVMGHLLRENGVAEERIVLEQDARDTLDSVENCAAILAAAVRGAPVYVVTDGFHLVRSVLLFRVYGVATRGVRIASARASAGWLRWLYYSLREVPAVPWDLALALVRRSRRA